MRYMGYRSCLCFNVYLIGFRTVLRMCFLFHLFVCLLVCVFVCLFVFFCFLLFCFFVVFCVFCFVFLFVVFVCVLFCYCFDAYSLKKNCLKKYMKYLVVMEIHFKAMEKIIVIMLLVHNQFSILIFCFISKGHQFLFLIK